MGIRSWFVSAVAAVVFVGGAGASRATTLPLGSGVGGAAVYFNGTGPATLANGAYLRLQVSATNSNGAQFDFDSTPLPGTGGLLSWYGIFQSVPGQFGLDLVAKLATGDGSVLPPVLDAYDNVDGSIANRTNAGPVSWAISGYQGSTVGPADPANAAVNSLIRGGTGASVIPTVPDGITVTAFSVTPSGSTQTLTFTAELNSDGVIHWYNPSIPNSPVGGFDLTGKLIVSGTLSAPLPGGPGMTFFSGPVTVDAEVVCGPRYVSPTGADVLPGSVPNVCLTAGTPCQTIQHSVDTACPGDTIHIAGGTYTENVAVTKALTLAGAGAATTTVRPALSAPNPCVGSSLCGGTASNIILVQASDVTIQGLTLDGDNTSLTSGVVRGGADVDARNGIIVDFTLGTFDNLVVHDVTVRNIYLRGVYASSGGTFDFHDNTIQNVQGEDASIAMFNFGGSGIMARNTVSGANDAVSSNHSRGVQFLDNVITASASGVHTDNAGDGGGTADILQGNTVTNCTPNGYGVWVFVPYLAPTVQGNSVTNCAVGLAAFGTGAAVTTVFTDNVVNGASLAGSTGVLVTTDQVGFGSGNVSTSFTGNTITGNTVGVDVEQQAGFTATASLSCNRIENNGTGITSQSGAVAAHQNAITGSVTGADGTGIASGSMQAQNNWWGCPGGPGNFGCSAATANVTFLPVATKPDVCIPATQLLNLTKAKLRGGQSLVTPKGTVVLGGDFFADLSSGDVFDASSGIGVRTVDSFGLDTTTLSPPSTGWASTDCKTKMTSGVAARITCKSPDKRLLATFRAVNPIIANSLQGYRFSIRMKKLPILSPFAGPVTVTLTNGTGTERVGSLSTCALTAAGLECRKF